MKKFLINLFVFTIILSPVILFAEGTANVGLKNPIGLTSISQLILIVVRVVRYILIPFVVIAIMYAGWLFLTANLSGIGKGMAEAKKALWSALIGGFIILSAELIAQVMSNTITTLTN